MPLFFGNVPHSNMPARLEISSSPRLVYLDNFVWSKLIKFSTGRISGAEATSYQTALPKLLDMVMRGAIVCPISFTHLAELSTYRNLQVRAEAIQLIGLLSQGACLPWAVPGPAPERWLTNVVGLFPPEADMLFVEASIEGLHPAEALCGLLQDGHVLAEMVDSTIQELTELLRTRKVPSSSSAEYMSTDIGLTSKSANVHVAWYHEIFRLRLADPNRGAERGDTIDLLNLVYASMTDSAILDKGHSAMISSSKLKKFWVDYRIEKLVEHLERLLEA